MVLSSIWPNGQWKTPIFLKKPVFYSLFIDLNLSYRKMLVIFLILDFFCFFFRKTGPQRGPQYNVCLIFVYFSWKKEFQKKKLLKIFHIKRVKNYWKKYFFEFFFPTEIYKNQQFCTFLDPNGTCFPWKKKKKSNIKKITSIFPLTQVKSINRELILQIFFAEWNAVFRGKMVFHSTLIG